MQVGLKIGNICIFRNVNIALKLSNCSPWGQDKEVQFG